MVKSGQKNARASFKILNRYDMVIMNTLVNLEPLDDSFQKGLQSDILLSSPPIDERIGRMEWGSNLLLLLLLHSSTLRYSTALVESNREECVYGVNNHHQFKYSRISLV